MSNFEQCVSNQQKYEGIEQGLEQLLCAIEAEAHRTELKSQQAHLHALEVFTAWDKLIVEEFRKHLGLA